MQRDPKPAPPPKPDLPFRVHFADGRKFDVMAPDATTARKAAEARHHGLIKRIKIVRENA